jgi:hypothetical protein
MAPKPTSLAALPRKSQKIAHPENWKVCLHMQKLVVLSLHERGISQKGTGPCRECGFVGAGQLRVGYTCQIHG